MDDRKFVFFFFLRADEDRVCTRRPSFAHLEKEPLDHQQKEKKNLEERRTFEMITIPLMVKEKEKLGATQN
ncbi:hypothetical protein OUZ56_000684 [Daphnia magna]|uniref:Uncharacterized protein n=1 Tax=Daphnia magna TaxID=35525 RepID=A0ABR0A169_9CRUS|nr:hypothetical protein OUZ56_000684 [Daphnia magna]